MSSVNGPGDPIPTVLPVEPQAVVPVATPPHPGFWMSLMWSVAFVIVVNGATLLALVPLIILHALSSGNSHDVLRSLIVETPGGRPVPTADLYRLLAPAVLIGQVVSILFGWLIVRWLVGPDWRRELAVRLPHCLHLALVLLGVPAFILLPELIAGLAKMVLPSSDYQKELDDMLRHWPWWLGVLGVGLGPGIGEELWCRGFLGRGLVGRYGVGLGIVLTSLFFGAMHLDPPHVVATAFMGAALHFVYLTTRSLIAPMLVHALNNSAGFILIYLAEVQPGFRAYLDGYEKYPLTGKLPVFAACAALLAAVGWALYRTRVRVVPAAWEPDHPGVATPPADSGAVLAHERLGWLPLGAVLVAAVAVGATLYWTGQVAKVPAPQPAARDRGELLIFLARTGRGPLS